MKLLRSLFPVLAATASAQICQTHDLDVPDPQSEGRVGYSLALHGDVVAAGGTRVDNAAGRGGAVYV